MRSNAKNSLIAAIVSAVLVSAAIAQNDLPERINVDSKVPLPEDRAFGIIDANFKAPDVDAIEEEIGIMEKVLEESLDNAGIEDWRSGPVIPNPHGSPIRGRYVPSVGVLFTVPVAFPIRSEAEYKVKPDEEDSGTPDLWQKHQRSSANYQVRVNKSASIAGKDGKFRVITPDSVVILDRIELDGENSDTDPDAAKATAAPDRRAVVEFRQHPGAVRGGGGSAVFGAGGGIGGAVADDFFFDYSRDGSPRPKYNEATVKKLNATLEETIAKYGHRLEHLGPEDRIFVIVESGARGWWGAVPVIRHLSQGSVSSIPASGPSTARYQIVVRKKDLTESTTPDALQGRIEKTEY